MKALDKVLEFLKKHFYNAKWRCIACNKEIFDDKPFCEECSSNLPFIQGAFCNPCGRKLESFQEYCLTCKGKLTNVDIARSVFNYDKPISTLIQKAKYYNGKYLLEVFSEYLFLTYSKNYFTPDVICFVPMTTKSMRKRGYNQSKELAINLSKRTGVKLLECIVKTKETVRQAKLNREGRLKNLIDAFSITDKTLVKDKSVLIVDDVSTTGATSEVLAQKLKSAGAKQVYLLTIASVAHKDRI